MRLKSSLKYQIWDCGKAMAAYYMILILVLVTYLRLAGTGETSGVVRSFMGIEAFTVLFSFIVGLYAFNDSFSLFIQNGLSRKTMFQGRCVTVAAMSFAAALAGQLLATICRLVNRDIIFGIYPRLYHAHAAMISPFRAFTEELMLNFSIYILFGCIGYFTAIMYYRMNRFWKFGVSVAIPALILWSVPYLDQMTDQNHLSLPRIHTWPGGFGSSVIITYGPVLISMLMSIVIAAASWYLLRSTAVKG